MWKVTVPHVIMETKQVIVNFALAHWRLYFSKYSGCLNKNLILQTRPEKALMFVRNVLFLREENMSCRVGFILLLGLFRFRAHKA